MTTGADPLPPSICASVLEPTAQAVLARMQEVAPWCALVEVRLDALARPPGEQDLRRIVGARPRTLVATCRPRREGGLWAGAEEERLALLARAAALGAEWVDVEWDAAEALPALPGGARRIVSRHVLQGRLRPDDVEPLLRSLRRARADVQKLAVPVEGAEEALDLLARCARESRPTLGVALGPRGVLSRMAGTRWGAPWVYASANPAAPAAPGSPPAEELAWALAGRTPGPASALCGVTGASIAHSRSPHVHNAAFAALGVDAVSTWLETDRPAALLEALGRDPRALGLAVTIPHKAALARLLDHPDHTLSDEARGAGAVNTLVRSPGRWSGHNTDVLAAQELLRRALADLGREPERARVGVVGAGGSARAVAFAAARLKCEVVVFARSTARARALGDAVHAAGAERSFWIRAGGTLFDIPTARSHDALHVIVNATPVGMHGDPLTSVPPDALGPGVVAYDLVYTPPDTPFLAQARARGARVVSGLDHFVRQARAQVGLWLEALERPPGALEALPLEWFEERTRLALRPARERREPHLALARGEG